MSQDQQNSTPTLKAAIQYVDGLPTDVRKELLMHMLRDAPMFLLPDILGAIAHGVDREQIRKEYFDPGSHFPT